VIEEADAIGPAVVLRSRVPALPIEEERTSPRTAKARTTTKRAAAA